MLTLTRKEFEIEEKIQLNDENGNVIYEFTMQITPEEKMKIRNLIFNEDDIKNGKKLEKLEKENNYQEYVELEAKVLENARKRQEEFEQICFKEHRENFKEKAQAKYEDMVEMLFDFFVQTFVENKTKQINTMSSHLRKISNK